MCVRFFLLLFDRMISFSNTLTFVCALNWLEYVYVCRLSAEHHNRQSNCFNELNDGTRATPHTQISYSEFSFIIQTDSLILDGITGRPRVAR